MSDTPDQIANDIQALADYVADYGLVGMTARIEAFVPRVRALSAHGQPVVDEVWAIVRSYIQPEARQRVLDSLTAALTGADQAGYWECVGTVRVGKEPWNAGLSVVDLEAPVPIGTKIYTAPRHTDCALTGAAP